MALLKIKDKSVYVSANQVLDYIAYKLAPDDLESYGGCLRLENNNTGYIHGNTKLHAFKWYSDNIMDWFLCGKYGQYADDIESVDIDDVDEKYLCKKCLRLYRK